MTKGPPPARRRKGACVTGTGGGRGRARPGTPVGRPAPDRGRRRGGTPARPDRRPAAGGCTRRSPAVLTYGHAVHSCGRAKAPGPHRKADRSTDGLHSDEAWKSCAMQMTETFAATVAAVAPVILLVGVVEVDQNRKALGVSLTAISEEYRSVLESLPAQPTREQVSAARARLEALTPEANQRTTRSMRAYFKGASWIILVFALVVAEGLSLGWLAKPEHGPATGQAIYCLVTLIVGMYGVATPPTIRLLRAPLQPLDARAREVRHLERLEQELSEGPDQ